MKGLLTPIVGIFALLGVLVTTAEAATVSITPSSSLTSVGATVTLSIEGSGFTSNTDRGSFTTTWDSSILQLASFTVANPPWDASFVIDSDPNDGLLDTFSVLTTTTGGVASGFLIGTLTFDVVGDGTTTVSLADDPLLGGWFAPGQTLPTITVTYEGATVSAGSCCCMVVRFGSTGVGRYGEAQESCITIAIGFTRDGGLRVAVFV